MPKLPRRDNERLAHLVALFTDLIYSRDASEFAKADRAQERLSGLGVEVTFTRSVIGEYPGPRLHTPHGGVR